MEVEDSQPDSARVLSVRIVDIDYYMAPPIPEIDICYSSFQGIFFTYLLTSLLLNKLFYLGFIVMLLVCCIEFVGRVVKKCFCFGIMIL